MSGLLTKPGLAVWSTEPPAAGVLVADLALLAGGDIAGLIRDLAGDLAAQDGTGLIRALVMRGDVVEGDVGAALLGVEHGARAPEGENAAAAARVAHLADDAVADHLAQVAVGVADDETQQPGHQHGDNDQLEHGRVARQKSLVDEYLGQPWAHQSERDAEECQDDQ